MNIVPWINLAAPASVILFILNRKLEDRKEFERLKKVLFDEMVENAERNNEIIRLIKKTRNRGIDEVGMAGHSWPLPRLAEYGWTIILVSGKLYRFGAKNLEKSLIKDIKEMYRQISIINNFISVRENVLFGPLRIVKIRDRDAAGYELDTIDSAIEKNILELKKTITDLNRKLE